ncbi:hypothetical protein DV713_08610 [Parageobacillus thermoglucosidasius]|uniref:hypothetical protein n=1 Tax=Parageobacillus thermoglucosidasius TaxID=1426 RepID=UPI000E178363|nr:hypothetical protein [Parageobacillus thermoglucosidasius]RDE34151.1 hypothetical protein DV713_08610 [Parageobacillus thermoglucosidasius]
MAIMQNPNIQKFKSKFCQWAQSNLPDKSVRKFASSLNQVLNKHIPDSDNFSQFMIRNLVDSKGLNISLIGEEIIIAPDNNRENLFVGVIMPSWDRGLRHICKDEHVYDAISWFFHFASQYVARSRIVDVIAALNLVYGLTCDFRGNRMAIILSKRSDTLKDEFIDAFMKETNKNSNFYHYYRAREKRLVFWINKFNSLDPYIHRISFNYLNACKLFERQFYEEAITSLDKTVDVVQQYARERMNINGTSNQRELTLTAFEMAAWEKSLLARLYDIRNFFGAHPSMSKWWDFYEIFEDDIVNFFDVVKRLIFKVVLHENTYRVVHKNPSNWSKWFADNAMMLWDAVWFENIQKHIR